MVDEPGQPERESSPPPRLRDDPSVPAGVRKMARDWHDTRPEPAPVDLSRVRASLLALEAASAPPDEDEEDVSAPPPRLRDDPSVPAGVRKMARDWHDTRPEPVEVDLSRVRASLLALEGAEARAPEAAQEPAPAEASNVVALGEGKAARPAKKRRKRKAPEPGALPQTGAKVVSIFTRLGQSKTTIAAVAIAAGAVLVPTLPRVLPMVATWWDELDHNTASPQLSPICWDLPAVRGERPIPPTEETRHLDEAHEELGRAYADKDLSKLLANLERDRARYGESAYSEEREVLMLQALGCQARDGWWAKRRLVRDGKAFLEKHPKSPYATAVQGMLERVR